jgi:hypothetical protein
MDFWNNKVGVSKEAAEMQISIIKTFSSDKRMRIALDFANLSIGQTREWIKNSNPNFSELEITLEFVRLMYYETGKMTEEKWNFYERKMQKLIKKDWSKRFRQMMKKNNWNYDDVAKLGNFKSGKVIEATVSRGLPSFAKLAVVIYERTRN